MKLPSFKLLISICGVMAGMLITGCALEKQSAFNRSMQNLTARYNILYNANLILAQKQESINTTYIDAYDEFLSVYQDTLPKTIVADKDLEAVITKANTIISIKDQSHYIGDAYMVLGKANYYEAKYYNAIEFFSYVTRSFAADKNLAQDALAWKARALMQTKQLPAAKLMLDTATLSIFKKQKNIADVYAAKLQYDIYTENYTGAEDMAKQAIQFSNDKNHQLRWTFILAQLQEINHKPDEAIKNYTRVANSNAKFEMAFNASLNRIRIEEKQAGSRVSRIDRLRSLLRDDKNVDFTDQIYYQIGELYYAQGNIDNAIKNYRLSVNKSTLNLNQKGLSYLRLADIAFKNKADYPAAKKYYDSTLISLPTTYPGYQIILKKANNLQLLADRYQIIAREDTLQMLAKLNDADRLFKINAMVAQQIAQQKAAAAAADNNNKAKNAQQQYAQNVTATNSSFYFYNANAVSQGYTDFKRVWGNRPQADNWRRSVRSGSEIANTPVSATIQRLNSTAATDQAQKTMEQLEADKLKQQWIQNVPLNQAQLTQSNSRIYLSYSDIANFYRDILDDRKEAIATYELILRRFPDNSNKPSIYYSLYRLYTGIDNVKSDYYKNLLLKDFPESNYAKVITDPQFNQKLNDKNAEFTAFYNQLFDLIIHRKYKDAIDRADELIKRYPANYFIPQVYYLRAIALGHTQKLEPFQAELQEILDKFPDDRLITPLVKQHLNFIAANQAQIAARPVVLIDSDPNDIPFFQEKTVDKPYVANNPVTARPQNKPAQPVTAPQAAVTPAIATTKPADVSKEAPSIFSLRDSANYYFVINVNTNTVNLAPSRFGIGQFNRANFEGNSIKHQLKPMGTNQLIYVGRFAGIGDVKAYARAISPLLPEIMKVPADKYTIFIITKENLDKLADQKTLDSYIDFYQKKY